MQSQWLDSQLWYKRTLFQESTKDLADTYRGLYQVNYTVAMNPLINGPHFNSSHIYPVSIDILFGTVGNGTRLVRDKVWQMPTLEMQMLN